MPLPQKFPVINLNILPVFIPIFLKGALSQQISAHGGPTGAKARKGVRQELALSVHPGRSQALPERLWGETWASTW